MNDPLQEHLAPQTCRSTNRQGDPEVWFRAVHLAPEIRENILSTPNAVRRPLVTERVLRPIATITDYHDQIREFHKLLG